MEDKLKQILSNILGHEKFSISSRPVDIENWSSLNHLRITIEINKKFGLNFDPDEIPTTEPLSYIEQILH